MAIGNEKNDFVIRFKNSKHKRSYSKRTTGVFDIDYGSNQLKSTKTTNVLNPDFNLWQTTYFGFSFNAKTRMFGENSALYFKYGIGLQWDNYNVRGNYYLAKTSNGVEYLHYTNNNLDDSNLKNLYMNLPVMLQLDFSKHGVDDAFKLGFGAYFLWRDNPSIKPFWDGRFDAHKHLFYGLPRDGFSKYIAYGLRTP